VEDESQDRQINIHLDPEHLAGVYANFANISSSDYEFTLTFARIDHEIANLLLLADASLAGRDIRVVRGGTQVRPLHAGERIHLSGSVGDLVTLLSVGGTADGVTTEGLRWPLVEATLEMGRSRGLSNEIIAAPASVRIGNGTLLVVETASRGGIS